MDYEIFLNVFMELQNVFMILPFLLIFIFKQFYFKIKKKRVGELLHFLLIVFPWIGVMSVEIKL